ncbi:MAG: heme ABC transporter ATP-binding protein [Deltaproteobacteria bacterium HGW-Deltaproteobacteria-10]|jgi:iron complex transport system ATP-binding protein|nr:MAG: heme ABC transporter ATP-binding protein [Deltaproteobacteria bacterium HGW-Deltaproteobacteria-2]PKN64850.1 MAG: heme ABC transporter ATP-binding protein [Deltaproteobacteria bacterium HGW-Deltaproteobacteria-10]
MPVIDARNISFSYATKPVMGDVSFTIDEAQIVAVIGPNGSGKTTLLKIINGTLFPDAGQMLIDGKETGRWQRKEIAQKVAIVPQETAMIFPFYAEEIVLMGRFPHLGRYGFEDKKDYKIVHEAMEKTDTLAFAERRFSELSAGERQRVLIARALAQEPKVLLLDESTVFLDLKHQVQFLALLRQLNTMQKLTVIFVTHDINLAAQNSDRIILLYSGKIYAIGKPAEVITAANIKEVYDVDVLVDQNPQNGLPRVTLLT